MQDFWCSVQSRASWVRGGDFWNAGFDAKVCSDDDHSVYGKGLHNLVMKDLFQKVPNCHLAHTAMDMGVMSLTSLVMEPLKQKSTLAKNAVDLTTVGVRIGKMFHLLTLSCRAFH